MSFRPAKRKALFVKKPDFNLIDNIYIELSSMVKNYGITSVLLHLGYIANEQISKEFASKIWYIVTKPTENKPSEFDQND